MDFEDFCRAEYPNVFRAAALASGNRDIASDATQEAFQRAFARWPLLRRQEWKGGWVTTTALNLCRKELRRRARRSVEYELEGPRHDRDVGQHVDIVAELQLLPFRQRQAVVLFYWSDYPIVVIAELMRISESAVRAHLAHARGRLRGKLEEHHV